VVKKPKDKPRKKSRKGAVAAKAAGELVGQSRLQIDGERFRYDCSGMVSAAYSVAGVVLKGGGGNMHSLAQKNGTFHERKRPEIGDVVFFDDTWDRNGNGKRDDKLTHVAIVESIDDEGTQTLVHLGGSGIKRIQMNLEHPDTSRNEAGETINSYIRRGRSGERLTGQLWAGYASLWDVEAPDGISMSTGSEAPAL
jgi:hypothetical protein